jgi:hypothetical protein
MRAGKSLIAVCFFVFSMLTVSYGAEGQPRFSFKQGETLKYLVQFHSESAPGAVQSSVSDLKGEAVLQALKVDRAGAATIKLVTSGTGKIIVNGKPLDLGGSNKPVQFLLTIEPDGTITKVMDAQGAKTSFMAKADIFNPAFSIQPYISMTYTLFGLQFPAKLPNPKGNWTGYQMQEGGTFANSGKTQITLKRKPVLYSYLGRQQVQGHNCLAFSYPMKLMGPSGSALYTIYFDDASGRVISTTLKGKSSEGSVAMSISLSETH